MKKLPAYLWILLIGALLLAVIFLAVDFKAASSTTTADSQVTTLRSGEGYSGNPPLVIYVQAPDNLAERLREEVFARVGTIAPFRTMALIETPGSEPGQAVLVVVVENRTYIWTPVYATANLSVRFAFASDGQVDWNQLGEVDTVMQGEPATRFSGELEFRDRSLGLISHPGYRSHVARQISDKVVEAGKTALTYNHDGFHRSALSHQLYPVTRTNYRTEASLK